MFFSNSDEQLYSPTNAQPITLEPHTRQALLANATYVRLSFLNQPKQQSQIELLDEQVTLFTQLTKQLRLSPNWKDQEIADALEIWLLQTLASKEVRPLLKRPSFDVAIKLIGDQPGRIQARRRAVMASWYLMTQPGNHVYAGGSIDWMLDLLEAVEKGGIYGQFFARSIESTLHLTSLLKMVRIPIGFALERTIHTLFWTISHSRQANGSRTGNRTLSVFGNPRTLIPRRLQNEFPSIRPTSS